MSGKQDKQDFTQVMQDGLSCPRQAPWPRSLSYISILTFAIPIGLAIYILANTSTIKLILWLIAFIVFAYPVRYLVCARCPYYGQHCSTIMGKLTPLLFKKQEGKSMKLGLWLDEVFFLFLFILPLPDTWRFGGFLMTALWVGAFLLVIGLITRFGCAVCPFTFCPIGKAGRAFWGLFGNS